MTAAWLLCLVIALLPSTIHTQAVTGVVANVNTSERLVGAEILLFSMDDVLHAAAFSGQNGEFFVEATEAGTYTMEVRHTGYKGRSAVIVLQTGKVVEVRVNLASEATALDGVTIYGQTAETPEQREFLSRRHLPWNYSFDMEEIERLRAANVMDVAYLGVPDGRMLCYTIYLDGRPNVTGTGLNLEYTDIPIGWVYGVEIYRTYLDVPLEYRDALIDPMMRCGAILIWSTVAPGAGLPSIWAIGLGASVNIERGVLDVAWRRAIPNRYVTSVRLRVGEYNPAKLLGSENDLLNAFEPDQRPPYISALIGRQGRAPWLGRESIYTRLSLGVSVYGGQSGEESVEGDTLPGVRLSVDPFVGFGGELAIGIRMPQGKVRPWLEVRTGTEYLTRTGFRWLVPVVTIGVELGKTGFAPATEGSGR